MLWLKRWTLPLAIFGLALGVRVAGLDGFLTADEPLWLNRARHFTGGLLVAGYECPAANRGREFATLGWGCTLQSEHPGVTTMGAGSLGLLTYYWQAIRPTGTDLPGFLAAIDMGHLDPAFIAPVRLPLAVVAALFVLLFYLLLRCLLTEPVALVAALLVALNPFHVALSRVLHHDALTTTFMVLSALALIGYWLQGWRWPWLVGSALLAGLALLSKPASWLLLPYAGVVGGLSLYYHQSGWPGFRRLIKEGLIWGLVTGLTYVAFFPAMWVMPGEVFQVVFFKSVEAAEEGHSLYFLGQVSDDPGPLFYPIGWLLQSSPLEVVGLLILPFALWWTCRSQGSSCLRRYVAHHPVEVALALFVGLFYLFTTIASKKLVRYFLPAFPVIDIFVAFGLLWLTNRLFALVDSRPSGWARQGALPILSLIVLLGQGGPVWASYPYYFTYYNPLFGGAVGAARLMTVGFGEGVDQAAAYLNQQPEAESLQVAVCGNDDLFSPFFVGEVRHCNEVEIMQADYVVYYLKTLQLGRERTTWSYFEKHDTPVHRVTIDGLDYVFIYRSPIDHAVFAPDNSVPDLLTTFGYNLAADHTLTLFWQNLGLGERELMVGLTSLTEPNGPARWVTCTPAPDFAVEMASPKAILESVCPLATAADAPPGLYDLQLGLGHNSEVTPINSSGLAVVALDGTGRFERVEPNVAMTELAEQALPDEATGVDIAYGDRLRLAGYQLEPAVWQPDQQGQVILYWQPVRQPDLGLASVLQLVLKLSTNQGSEPLLTTTQPLLPESIINQAWARGSVTPVHYPLLVPAAMPPGQYVLEVCLAVAGQDQVLPGIVAETQESMECLPVAVRVNGLADG